MTTPTLEEELTRLYKMRQHIDELKRVEKMIEADILTMAREDIANQLAKADYGAGTATLAVDGMKVKVVVSKKVSYEQAGLAAIREQLTANGEDPNEYVSAKYDVAEAAYKQWPTSLQRMFEPYRTVEVTKPTIKIEV
jgi:hypothetical protein